VKLPAHPIWQKLVEPAGAKTSFRLSQDNALAWEEASQGTTILTD